MSEQWLDIGGVAVHFGVSEKTVRRWIADRERLGLAAEMRGHRWWVDIATITHAEPASKRAVDSAEVARLQRELEDARRRADAALAEVGRWRGRAEAQEQQLLEWKGREEEERRQLAEITAERDRLAAELERRQRRGWLARLLGG